MAWSAPPPPLRPWRPPLRTSERLLLAAVSVLLVVGVLAAALRGVEAGGTDHPDRWDARVLELVDFVEEARGLRFDHPVEVQFLTPEEYRDLTGSELAEEEGEEAIEELEAQVARLRALGVVSGDLDLGEVLDQTVDASTLAFYRPEDQTIRVRGTEITVGLRVTLVHELTHALQDQHFDLDGMMYAEDIDSGAANAALALIEGDATRIEETYVDVALDDDEQDAYFEEYDAEIERSEVGNAGVPEYIQAVFGVPYALGPPFATMLANANDNEGVDEAFRSPPTEEEHLFDPASYLAGEKSGSVSTGIPEGDVEEAGEFGVTQWFLVLAERIDPFTALLAAIGWNGDEYAVVERDDRTCVRAVFRGDTEADEAEMADAIGAWLAALPGDRAEAVEVQGRPGLDACDPGPEVDLRLNDRATDVLVLPYLWSTIVAAHADSGPDVARCMASRSLTGLDYERVVDPDPDVRESVSLDLRRRSLEAASACGSGDR